MKPSLSWPIDYLPDREVLRSENFGITAEAKSVAYPVRLLRYWFGYHLMRDEARRAGRPVSVAEIGVETGQMLRFAKLALSRTESKAGAWWSRWSAVDVEIREAQLREAGYSDFQNVNLDEPDLKLAQAYDIAICLHVFEHLFDPEAAVRKLVANLAPGGVLIGGFPSVPDFCVAPRERAIRKTARKFGHVSVFSPPRVRRMCRAAGCEVEFLSGAFFMRKKGNPLENSPQWLKFNILWGSLFPAWPGEIYWLARKIT